ncbi:MAG: hypothetical protein V4466_15725, partial [Pseudomonadota bacterium]
LSGRSVRQCLEFFQLTPVDLLVISDDLNLPLGQLRMRASGSDGRMRTIDLAHGASGAGSFQRRSSGWPDCGDRADPSPPCRHGRRTSERVSDDAALHSSGSRGARRGQAATARAFRPAPALRPAPLPA